MSKCIERLARKRTVLIAVISSVLVLACSAVAVAYSGDYYWLGNLAPGGHMDSNARSFTQNYVEDYQYGTHRVCAGQAYADGGGFYGTYKCDYGSVDRLYSDPNTRLARAHNGDGVTFKVYAETRCPC